MSFIKKIKSIFSDIKSYKKTSSFILLTSVICFYFLYYIIYGKSGILHYFEIKEEIQDKKIEKGKLKNELSRRQNMINSIKTDALDLDLLDEQTRKNLGYAKDSEVIIYENNK